ncbi:BBT_HP_G0133100.mRNA.1.CDS.1 [Saccharomyces cerevisiae]|nr:BBT_HP_G0082690.mRNA.1.CDS.1 [Saccharomyces cerevisiae]CAI5018915.1 BBT_HP_G0096720.mRNA.1.CDS.1 [Saccharomyces cerevisiae]CAI5108726.1 BBT_HP_G0133100.mRNA.1.CDS.1 [Saccharomyces cerevisiae]CAI6910861.1 BBT_HP_G0082690.mRNA.1.CDS.1 [Saccharomyces cerevisiae]CAI6935371.1 BBT_HP_G0096720.mRNA.1.CDS.1 [Saccharomyces cerevisiae]
MSTNILQHVKQLLHNRDVFSFFHNKTGNLNYLDNTTQKPEVFVSPNSTIVSAPTLDSFQALMEKGNFTTLQLAKVGIRMFFSYSVSKYAVLCFSTAIILNRLTVMSSLRSNSTNIRLPLWSKTLLHLVATLSLVKALLQILSQFGLMHELHVSDTDFYALSVYLFVALSDCIEIFISSTTNVPSLICSDFSIWGLSLNLYIISKMPAGQQHIGDNVELLGAVFHRLVIHLVELFHIRAYRLCGEVTLNAGFFTAFVTRTYLNGLDFINICLIHNYFPGFFYISTILLASIGIFLKALFTSNPFRSLYSRYKNLEKWWRSNNYNGEEEFNEIALSLCLLLTSNDYKIFKKSDNVKSVDEVAAFSNSYVVSGHLNQLQSTPEDLLSRKEMTTDSQLPGFARTYLGLFELVRTIILTYSRLLKNLLWSKNFESSIDKKPRVGKRKKRDLNKYVTEKNYKKFLYKPDVKELNIESDLRSLELLLPEDDSSKDYFPPRKIDESVSDEEFDSDMESQLIIDEEKELTHLSSNAVDSDDLEEIAWNISMWSILNYEMDVHNKVNGPLTRSQYGKRNPQGVLVDVVIERLLHHTNSRYMYKRLNMKDDDKLEFKFDFAFDSCDEVEEMDLSCLICKVNKRNIVTWPCRCLALCDDCRISLGYKGFATCVSCDSEVKGYSKLNIV